MSPALRFSQIIGINLIATFLLHLAWENAQAPLFAGFLSFTQHFPLCLWATFGDLLMMIVLYTVIGIVHRDRYWILQKNVFAHPATWILPPLIGLLLAIIIELHAVYVTQRWTYDTMPLVPVIPVGLTPLLQMIIIPILTLLLLRFMTSKFHVETPARC